MGLSLVVGALSARYLGPSNYGLIGYGASLVNLFTAISQLGIDNVLINEMMKHPEEKGRVMGTALCMRGCSAAVSLFCAMILVILIEPGNHVLWFVTGIQAFAIALRAYELLNEWFLSEMKSKYYVVANICGQTVVGIWKIVLLILQASVVWFAASTTVQAFVCGGIVITVFLMTRDFKLGFCLQYAKDIFDRSKHYVLAGLAIALYTQMDKVMLGRMMGEREVGFYTAAMTIAMLWEFIPQAIINSSRVVILEKKKSNENSGRSGSTDLWKTGGPYTVWKRIYGSSSCAEAADLVHYLRNDWSGEKHMERCGRQESVFEKLHHLRGHF